MGLACWREGGETNACRGKGTPGLRRVWIANHCRPMSPIDTGGLLHRYRTNKQPSITNKQVVSPDVHRALTVHACAAGRRNKRTLHPALTLGRLASSLAAVHLQATRTEYRWRIDSIDLRWRGLIPWTGCGKALSPASTSLGDLVG